MIRSLEISPTCEFNVIVALGVRHFGTEPRRQTNDAINPSHALQVFSKRHNAIPWQYWRIAGLTTWDPFFFFEKAYFEALAHAQAIYFNLDGFNLPRAWLEGRNTDFWQECPNPVRHGICY